MTKEMCDMDEPNFYAIIPADVRYNKSLTQGAKLLYGEITALCNQKGFCWASNLYFAQLYDVNERSIQRWINSLKDNGYIIVDYHTLTDTNFIDGRCISIVENRYDKNVASMTKMSSGGDKNVASKHDKNVTINNTSTNTTFNNTLKENTKRKIDVENVSLGLEFNPERLFESFWKTYPRKDSKSESKKEFLKVCKNQNIYNDIMKSLATQVVLKKLKKNDRYTPHARTWLHQERWKDELDAEPTKPLAGTKDKYGIPIL